MRKIVILNWMRRVYFENLTAKLTWFICYRSGKLSSKSLKSIDTLLMLRGASHGNHHIMSSLPVSGVKLIFTGWLWPLPAPVNQLLSPATISSTLTFRGEKYFDHFLWLNSMMMQEPMIPSLHVPTAHHQHRRRSLPRIPDFQQNSTAPEDYGGEIFCHDNV